MKFEPATDDRGGLFATAARLLEDPSSYLPESDVTRHAGELLKRLRYVGIDEGALLADSPISSAVTANRIALLRLAARLETPSVSRAPLAPGAILFGAMWGIPPIGFSGCSEDLRGAFESCMGEAAEYLSFLRRADDPLVSAVDDTLPAKRFGGGVTTAIPAGDILRSELGAHPTSTGLGAGVEPHQAMQVAMLEAVERDAIARWWCDGASARAVIAGQARRVSARLSQLRRHQGRQSWFLDLTPDHGIPVAAALSSAPDGCAVVAGFAAAPTLDRALYSAMLEMCQMEFASDLSWQRYLEREAEDLSPTDMAWVQRRKHLSVRRYRCLQPQATNWPERRHRADVNTAEQLANVLSSIGHHALFVDITRPDIGIFVFRAVIEGFQDVKVRMGDYSDPDSICPI